ncbi:MAG: T9SS type A sorting domain-containing protein [Saprospiraceae bacterium]|nr:T9SS type A sorting domain-containing protein [Saprospiraceae bacterium]
MPVTITSGGQFPVELTSFTARYQDKISKLNWVTESEKDSKGFNIERSINGSDFENIGFVASSGNSYIRKNYNFNDTKVNDLKSKIVYYRLNQIDFNNDSELSEIVSVQIPFEEEIKVYPNPTSDKLIIEIGESVPDFFNISIYDISGRLIIDYDAEKRNFSKLDIDIKDITTGIYFIKLKANEQIIFADKIIKK